MTAAELVIAGVLVDGTGEPALEDAALLVGDGLVLAAGPIDQVSRHRLADGAGRRDVSSCTVTPGLIDGHVHLAYGREGDPGWADFVDSPGAYAAWGLAGAQAALRRGVTTVRDCGSPDGVALDIRRLLAGGFADGSRVLACGPCITTTGGHGDFLGVTADGVDELRTTVRELAHRRPDAIKVMATGGSMDPHTNRRKAQYSTDELAVVVAEAGRLGVQVVAHANATEGIRNAVLAGVQVIAHCNFLSIEDGRLDVDPEVVRELVGRKVHVDLNLEAAMTPLRAFDASAEADVPEDRWRLLSGLDGLAPFVFFTSDAFGPQVGRFPELLSAAAVRWRLGTEEVLWRATGLAAEALGVADRLGTLLPGRVADFVVHDSDLRTGLGQLSAPRHVFQSGRQVAGPLGT